MSEREYKEMVLADYDRRFASGLLPSELLSPTPAGLKAEAVKICERRFSTRDETILKSFFNQKEDMAGYRMAIQNCNADLFKPLILFLRDRSINTKLRNIDLLAWLIDFNPRPFHPNLVYKQQVISPVLQPLPDFPEIAGDTGQNTTAKSSGKIKKWAVLSGLLIIVMAVVIYLFLQRGTQQLTGREGCMVWRDDHYQPVHCDDQSAGNHSLFIDHQLVDHFRRITRPDTLTVYSIGKVWYAKYNGRVEFYTAAGMHPLDSNRRLLPMSDHILKKYVYHMTN